MGFFGKKNKTQATGSPAAASASAGSGSANGPHLVVGLGNPGPEYVKSRHNAGFMTALRLISRHGLGRTRSRYGGRWVEGKILDRDVALLMPETYMNRSGDAVWAAASRKHVSPERIIVVHDDLDFPFGVVRCRGGGGTGGHNGLASIVSRLGTSDFLRVRIGIGRPENSYIQCRDWVLGDFDASEKELLGIIDAAADCVESILAHGIEHAMQQFNRRESDL